MAKSDNMHGAAQIATFWHSNAAPQWQIFNGGNWNALENAVRKFAASEKKDLICYTGTFVRLSDQSFIYKSPCSRIHLQGIATLPDINGNDVELFLSADDRTMPVPRMFFKILYDPKSQAGIAIAGMNNPYESLDSVLSNVRCRDICNKVRIWKMVKSEQFLTNILVLYKLYSFSDTVGYVENQRH